MCPSGRGLLFAENFEIVSVEKSLGVTNFIRFRLSNKTTQSGNNSTNGRFRQHSMLQESLQGGTQLLPNNGDDRFFGSFENFLQIRTPIADSSRKLAAIRIGNETVNES